MTKNKFLKCKIDNFTCEKCGNIVNKENISYSSARDNGSLSMCKACTWIENAKKRNFFIKDKKEKDLIYAIFNDGINILNDAREKYESLKNLSDKELCELWQSFGIKGKSIKIKGICKTCGKEVLQHPCNFLENENLFCGKTCYYIFQKENAKIGEENWQYNRIKTTCSNCGKELNLIKAKASQVNSFGETHNFCCKECYYKFRSKYYIKERNNRYNKVWTEEEKERARHQLILQTKSANRLNSKIQLKINSILEECNIKYEREYIIDYYAIDNFLLDYNLCIEVMGDYWHSNPNIFNENKYKLNTCQAKGIHTDKSKKTYIKNHRNINILYLWESDIDSNIELCKQLILKYIHNSGILDNYHSFNYSLGTSNKLCLNKSIIIPYQDMEKEKYEKIIKRKA